MPRGSGIVVVTGSNGRIGDAVMRRFAGRFESIVGFDRARRRRLRRRGASMFPSRSRPASMDDLVDAIELTVERRASLPPEVAILLGEPEVVSYDELQHTFARRIHGEEWETLEVPSGLAPLPKAGAWVMGKLPGADPFIRPWMIDRTPNAEVLGAMDYVAR